MVLHGRSYLLCHDPRLFAQRGGQFLTVASYFRVVTGKSQCFWGNLARFRPRVCQIILVNHSARVVVVCVQGEAEPGSRPSRRAAPQGQSALTPAALAPSTQPIIFSVGSSAADMTGPTPRSAPFAGFFLRHRRSCSHGRAGAPVSDGRGVPVVQLLCLAVCMFQQPSTVEHTFAVVLCLSGDISAPHT